MAETLAKNPSPMSFQSALNVVRDIVKANPDAVLVNDVQDGKGFGAQANTLTPLTAQGAHPPIGPLSKDQLARAVVQWWAQRLETRPD